METANKPNHIGRKISRIRELRGLKQEALAQALGVSQQTVSTMENSETVDDVRLAEVAEVLGVTIDAIKNFSEEAVFNFFNTFSENDFSNSQGANFGPYSANHCTFNPLDKLIQAFEENKQLYERLLQAEREKATLYENLYKNK